MKNVDIKTEIRALSALLRSCYGITIHESDLFGMRSFEIIKKGCVIGSVGTEEELLNNNIKSKNIFSIKLYYSPIIDSLYFTF